MADTVPNIDERTAVEIVQQAQYLLSNRPPLGYSDTPLDTDSPGAARALVNIFGRFSELIIQRLNQAPAKNFLAYLDLLGASLVPPVPARAPLTFSLAPGSVADAVVPPGTQVASPPAPGESAPVIFETETEAVITATRLAALWVRDPSQDKYADRSAYADLAQVATQNPVAGVPAFRGDTPIEHILYIGDDALALYPAWGPNETNSLHLTFTLDKPLPNSPDDRQVIWEIWDGQQGIRLSPDSDTSQNLKTNGMVAFKDLPLISLQTVDEVTSRWLRARLATPITRSDQAQPGMVRAAHLPALDDVKLDLEITRSGMPFDAGFANLTRVDLTKDFFPFGEKPRVGDALYLASMEAFSQPGASITINVDLSDPNTIPVPTGDTKPQLRWEYWNGTSWQPIPKVKDDTNNLTHGNKSVTFDVPGDLQPREVNGVRGSWIRVRIASGNYGKDYEYVPDQDPKLGYHLVQATFRPPSIAGLSLVYSVTHSVKPAHVVTYNDFAFDDPDLPGANNSAKPVLPFQPTADANPTLYLGFTLPATRKNFPNLPLCLYFRVAEIPYGAAPDNPNASTGPELVWEYWDGMGWRAVRVNDGTAALTRPGLVQWLPDAGIQLHSEFLLAPSYWLRVSWAIGDYEFEPGLSWVLLNTTMAAQTVTFASEIVGSSNGTAQQTFKLVHAPVLPGQLIDVREPELPPASEREALIDEEGKDAIPSIAPGAATEIWIRWHEVTDLYASGPRSRHYIVDHLTGEITFGDGVNGLIPPAGANNLRARRYQTGGGSKGNRPPRSIVQLKKTVPYISGVTNPDAATGGTDAEKQDSLIARAPRTIRHRGRAVTLQDFEDLAMLVTPEVARVKCVPIHDLDADPTGVTTQLGAVSLIIVPRSTDAAPVPSLELIRRVQEYVEARRIPTARLVVVGPQYRKVNITADVALRSLDHASEVEQAAREELAKFLHPLTGGSDRAGWDFGRQPHRSDIYRLLESISGVDHVDMLTITPDADTAPVSPSAYFMISAGNIDLHFSFEQD